MEKDSRAMNEKIIEMVSPGIVKRTESSDRGEIGKMSQRKGLLQMVRIKKKLNKNP